MDKQATQGKIAWAVKKWLGIAQLEIEFLSLEDKLNTFLRQKEQEKKLIPHQLNAGPSLTLVSKPSQTDPKKDYEEKYNVWSTHMGKY